MGYPPRTLLHVHRVLSEALAQALRWQIIPRNVCQSAETPRAGRAEIQLLSPEEARRLLEVARAEDSSYGDAIILALHTGLRLGELLGLRWEDVDPERGRVTVRRSLQYLPSDGLALRELKTARGSRTIPLGSTALGVLRRLRRRQLEERLALGPAQLEQGLVFGDAIGNPLPPYRLSQWFASFVRKGGFAQLRFHDLRHAHATLCWREAFTRRWSASASATPASPSPWTPTVTFFPRSKRKQPET